MDAFCKVIGVCFDFNAELERQYVNMCKIAMDRKEQTLFLAYSDGVPVSTITLSTLPTSAGIWSCATLPNYRNKGIGTFLCCAASIEAKKRNYQKVMAIIMPKGLAWGLFKKLGYKEISTLPFYLYGASPDEIEK